MGGVVVGAAAVQRAAVVPDDEVADAPGVPMDELALRWRAPSGRAAAAALPASASRRCGRRASPCRASCAWSPGARARACGAPTARRRARRPCSRCGRAGRANGRSNARRPGPSMLRFHVGGRARRRRRAGRRTRSRRRPAARRAQTASTARPAPRRNEASECQSRLPRAVEAAVVVARAQLVVGVEVGDVGELGVLEAVHHAMVARRLDSGRTAGRGASR